MIPQLTPRLKRMLRRCFVKIDENTIEIKEKRGVIIKLWVLFTMIVFGYYNFIHPDYRQTTFDDLKFTFQPETRFQKELRRVADPKKTGYTKYGDTEEEFLAEMWEIHKDSVWRGYVYPIMYFVLLLILLKPAKR